MLNVRYPTEESLKGAVETFSKSNLSLTEIESLAKTMTPEYQASAASLAIDRLQGKGFFN